eukprot:CAMPEP_0177337272 /NCGR_PEP_ID=MMETSP0368-20130122/24231_1 /TAXON_ID=447022 ORGANISM="Scrippsiella hangoei-like, Strain SHHI-4" /NCGR_SAMPLE_ID=MMETSP0368 /ASSEMBLY_ACC=CAM_ASM_000363 /LENGTH=361 /DNA_ID=CAMNT_0018798181 /DNA_START=47 /DNA_END=1128 /DNA_ORIENTATION=+
MKQQGPVLGSYGPFATRASIGSGASLAEEREPLINANRSKAKASRFPLPDFRNSRAGYYASAAAKSLLLPLFAFLGFGLLFTFLWHPIAWLVNFACGFAILLCLGGSVLSLVRRRTDRAYSLAVTGMAVMAGSLQGYYNYELYTYNYWAVNEHREYVNVLADDSAAAHADASVLYFVEDAKPDLRYASSFGTGAGTFCAAPVTVGQAVVSEAVQFWVVGRDCCGARGFYCDSVRDKEARAGMVVYNRTQPFEAWTGSEMHFYEQAIEMSYARFGVMSAERHILVRWTSTPWLARNLYLHDGFKVWLKAALVSLPIWLVLGLGAPTAAASAAAFEAKARMAAGPAGDAPALGVGGAAATVSE